MKKLLLATTILSMAAFAAYAQDNSVKIGVLNDQSTSFSAIGGTEVVKALDPEFLETGRASAQINYPGVAPLSITNVSKARDFIGQVIVTAIQGGNVKTALSTAFTQCVDLLKEERAKKS